jgi:D-3-phosphoglycerate dehydrogenase
VIWNGESVEDQHHVQQIMEKDGPEAVPTPMEIVKATGDAEVLTTHFAPIPEAVLEAGPKLKAVIVSRTGVENVNVAAASERGIALVNVRGRNASSVAEQAIGLMLTEVRNVARADAGIRAGRCPKKRFPRPAYDIGGRTVGLIGFGHVARQLASRLSGFEVRVLVYDPYVDAATIASYGGREGRGDGAHFPRG